MSVRININKRGANDLIRRMARTRVIEMQERYRKAVDTFSSIIYIANDTAGFAIFDAITYLRKSPLYRQKVKKVANEANKLYDVYMARLHANFLDSDCEQLYLDFADNFQDAIKKHVEMLRLSAFQFLTKEQHPDRELLSYIISAYACLILAVDVFDGFFKAQQEHIGCNVRKECADFYLKPVRDKWRELVTLTVGDALEDRMCRDKNFQLACRCLEKQIANDNSLNGAASKAMQDNKKTVIKHLKKRETNEQSI